MAAGQPYRLGCGQATWAVSHLIPAPPASAPACTTPLYLPHPARLPDAADVTNTPATRLCAFITSIPLPALLAHPPHGYTSQPLTTATHTAHQTWTLTDMGVHQPCGGRLLRNVLTNNQTADSTPPDSPAYHPIPFPPAGVVRTARIPRVLRSHSWHGWTARERLTRLPRGYSTAVIVLTRTRLRRCYALVYSTRFIARQRIKRAACAHTAALPNGARQFAPPVNPLHCTVMRASWASYSRHMNDTPRQAPRRVEQRTRRLFSVPVQRHYRFLRATV